MEISFENIFNLIWLADVIILVLNHTTGGSGVSEKAFPCTSYSERFLRLAQVCAISCIMKEIAFRFLPQNI